MRITIRLLSRIIFILLFFIVTFAGKKQNVTGVWHLVKPKQTLWRIAYIYKVPIKYLARVNNIKDISQIKAGDFIFIPGHKVPLEVGVAPVKSEAPKYNFILPIAGKIVTYYRGKSGENFNGIDIQPYKANADIKAAENGVVKYIGYIEGYGTVIIIKHSNLFYTVYAGVADTYAKLEMNVTKGDVIGTCGDILHFQLIKNGYPVNPVEYIKQ